MPFLCCILSSEGTSLQNFVRCNHQIFCFLLFLLASSADTIFHKSLEPYSALFKKKIFVRKFSFLTDSLNPPIPHHHHPFNSQNLLSLTIFFCQCSFSANCFYSKRTIYFAFPWKYFLNFLFCLNSFKSLLRRDENNEMEKEAEQQDENKKSRSSRSQWRSGWKRW